MQEINKEICEKIKQIFQDIQTTRELLELLNAINKYKYLKKSKPLELKSLTYHAYYNKNKYSILEISKKSGDKRLIYPPTPNLKKIQSLFNVIFQCLYKIPKGTHGFVLNKSNVTNAKVHIDKNYIYTIDLKDFFSSIHQARFWKRLQFPPYNLDGTKIELANLIANLVFLQTEKQEEKNFLPQGAPTSPIVSNIICERLDRRLLGLAKRFNVKYTRYADDITFSSNHNVYQKDSELIIELNRIIANENFEINPKKTRLQKKGYRQEVTGIVVNSKANVRRKYIKEVRTYFYLIEKYGLEKAERVFVQHQYKNNPNLKNYKYLSSVLLGKLEYLKSVKGKEDSTYLKLKNRYDICFPKEETSKEKNLKLKKEPIHNPKEVVAILNLFTQNNNILKYTTHNWDKEELDSLDNFLKEIKIEWNKVNNRLKELTPRLHAKIISFLFSKKLGTLNLTDNRNKVWRWGMSQIQFGWSSPKLREWTKEGNSPFSYVLDEKYRKKIDGKSIDRFSDIVEVFKNEIEIRSDNNQLKKLFISKQKKYLGFDFNVEFVNLEGVDFYTDVQHLDFGLNEIFKEIKQRKLFPKIKIEAIKNIEAGFIELCITHIDSFPNKTKEEMIKEVEDGDFSKIKEKFTSICDWSIASKLSDGNYKINYLGGEESFEKLNEEPIGFTHILKFYK